MKKYFISSAYIYPLCPLNINHAKMFIIGDIMARYYREKGYDVYFPIASHYSGNTAQKFSKAIETIFNNKNKEKSNNKEEQRIFDLYNKVYLIPRTILKSFKEPMNLLNYFNSEILWELKALNISGNYEAFYTTKNEDFSVFVNTIISKYKENNLWIKNIKEELAVDYNNKKWKQRTIEVINRTEFIQPVMKNSILSATEHIRNDWGTLRDNGFGVKYQNRWIIDPMFDSELFTIFDVYMKFSRKEKEEHDLKELFHNLFNVLQKKEKPKSTIVKKIVEYLPCDMFICEEHLKNWILKKFYAESLLLKKKHQTKKYFILGMGLLDGKRMSASKGHCIFARDLINEYGRIKARLIILLGGGHPSKEYNYDRNLPSQAEKMLSEFINYFTYLICISEKELKINNYDNDRSKIINFKKTIDENIKKGYFREVIINLFNIIPRKNKYPSYDNAQLLIKLYRKYLKILLPGLINEFNY